MITPELRRLQEQQLKSMREVKGLLASKEPVRAGRDGLLTSHGTLLWDADMNLAQVSIAFATAFLDANEAGTLSAEEYKELGGQNLKSQEISNRADRATDHPDDRPTKQKYAHH
jgi:hypothetical protein